MGLNGKRAQDGLEEYSPERPDYRQGAWPKNTSLAREQGKIGAGRHPVKL
jgi:hypothetical protein